MPPTFRIRSRYVHFDAAEILLREYNQGHLAVVAYDPTDPDEIQTLSVNLIEYDMVPDHEDEFYVRDYGASEGLADALVTAGIATIVTATTFGPFATPAVLMQLNPGVSA